MFELELLQQAEVELAEAVDWYEDQQAGLSKKFYQEIDHYFELVASDPYLFAIRYKEDIRTVALRIFPYLIIYWIDENRRTIFIISIFHTSRNPEY